MTRVFFLQTHSIGGQVEQPTADESHEDLRLGEKRSDVFSARELGPLVPQLAPTRIDYRKRVPVF